MGHENEFALLNCAKDPKKSCSTRKNFIQKDQIEQKTVGQDNLIIFEDIQNNLIM